MAKMDPNTTLPRSSLEINSGREAGIGKRAALTKIKSQIYTWPTTDWLYEFNILADTGGKGGASHQPFICPRL